VAGLTEENSASLRAGAVRALVTSASLRFFFLEVDLLSAVRAIALWLEAGVLEAALSEVFAAFTGAVACAPVRVVISASQGPGRFAAIE
jgi:hypothetical protein